LTAAWLLKLQRVIEAHSLGGMLQLIKCLTKDFKNVTLQRCFGPIIVCREYVPKLGFLHISKTRRRKNVAMSNKNVLIPYNRITVVRTLVA
jgi:hypothetical protein